MKYVIDTNVLLDDADVIDRYDNIVLCAAVLEELDGLKKNPDVKYRAQQAIKKIEANYHKIEIDLKDVFTDFPFGWNPELRDNKICAVALQYGASMISNDINVRNKARALGITVVNTSNSIDNLYKGYRELNGDTEFINQLFGDVINGGNSLNFHINEYLILNNTDLKNTQEYRYDGDKFVALKLPPSKVIKGMNSPQRCALDLLNNKDIGISILLGLPGSGKTFMATRMGLYHAVDKGNVSKVLVVREPKGEGSDVGYLRGNFEDKTSLFFKPIEHCLEGGEFMLQGLIQRGVLETNIPFYLKGTTYNSTYMMVDEASDLSMKQIRMIGTRIGKDSQICFVGDYKQSVNNATTSNPLLQTVDMLKGNPHFGCITLQEDVRSDISKIFADM